VVITGQYHPQSAENSVYAVRAIDNETIQNQGAIQLSDVLSKELNIRLSPDMATGETGFSIQGMKGSNVKILVDGIPLVGRNGNGNNADVSQINLNTIERIEIVEGPMAVNYGANALGGVINLITKTGSIEKFSLGASFQAESIDDKIGLEDGKYVANINSKYWFTDTYYTNFNVGFNRFNGFQGDLTGREQQWNPKTQFLSDISLGRQRENFHIYYKLNYLLEEIYDAGPVATGQTYAFDEKYTTNRMVHQVQANGTLYDGNRYSLIFSYSDNNRIKNSFIKDLVTGEKTNTISPGAQDTTTYNAVVTRGTYSAVEVMPWLDFELGYDINLEKTTGGRLTTGSEAIQDYAIFASAEMKPSQMVKIRPGIRWAYNSKFASPFVPSINIKYSPTKRFDLRAAYGRGYRAPGLRELYMEFIDATHRVFGNEDLVPETSHHVDAGFVFRLHKKNIILNSELSGFYNDITNLIDFAYSETDAGYAKYTNIGEFKSVGFNIKERFNWKALEAGVGFGYIGRYDNPTAEDIPDNFLFSPEVSIDATYIFSRSGITLSTFYKYTGTTSQYTYSTDENGNEGYNLSTVGDYDIWDITATRMMGKMIRLTLGAKNIMNTTNISNTTVAVGGVHSNNGNRPISYGRSFFIKLDFNLN
jgi:outer membrane receptor for ferrienterochelin and colicins